MEPRAQQPQNRVCANNYLKQDFTHRGMNKKILIPIVLFAVFFAWLVFAVPQPADAAALSTPQIPTFTITTDPGSFLVALNTDSDVYTPHEEVTAGFSVIRGGDGVTLCNATAYATITVPDGRTLDVPNENIARSKLCGPGPENPTHSPDYAFYLEPQFEGEYAITLFVNVAGNEKQFVTKFFVKNNPELKIKREGPTRIWYEALYNMPITISASENFSGVVREKIPEGFTLERISDQGKEIAENGEKFIEWELDIKKGEEKSITYLMRPPKVQGVIVEFGPLELIPQGPTASRSGLDVKKAGPLPGLVEKRTWQTAMDPSGDGTNAVAPSSGIEMDSTGNTFTFSFTNADFTTGGEIAILAPTNWSTPQGSAGSNGYTTATTS